MGGGIGQLKKGWGWGGSRKNVSYAEAGGGGASSLGVVLTLELNAAILKEAAQNVYTISKGESEKRGAHIKVQNSDFPIL